MAQISSSWVTPSNSEQTSSHQRQAENTFPQEFQALVPNNYSERSFQASNSSARSLISMPTDNNTNLMMTIPRIRNENQLNQKLVNQLRELLPPISLIFHEVRQIMDPKNYTQHESHIDRYDYKDDRYSNISLHSRESSQNSLLSDKGEQPHQISEIDSPQTVGQVMLTIPPPPPIPPSSYSICTGIKSPPLSEPRCNLPDKLKSYSIKLYGKRSSPCCTTQHDFVANAVSIGVRKKSEHLSSPKHISEIKDLKTLEPQNISTSVDHSKVPPVSENNKLIKDGIGPKIWTGNKFLPRFRYAQDIPGEGRCYFYDDGTHCKAMIDGEMVNADWGVTKTGKPRKRLAIACITCREKKIKCDPKYPSCIQCQRFGRVCIYKNAPRGGQSSPDTPHPNVEGVSIRQKFIRSEEPTREQRVSTQSVSPRQMPQHEIFETEAHHSKRQKIGKTDSMLKAFEFSPNSSVENTHSQSVSITKEISNPIFESINPNQETRNSQVLWPERVADLLTMFFRYVPETIRGLFTEKHIKKWALNLAKKSHDECTTLNAILCFASVFAQSSELRAMGEVYAYNCQLGCKGRPYTLQFVHSHLFLALYYFASNRPEIAWNLCRTAIRTACKLKLNRELDESCDVDREDFPYDLNRAGYAECRRRTFWNIYLIDRFNFFCAEYSSDLKVEEIFLRLPCDTNSFESQIEVYAPYFDHTTLTIPIPSWKVGCLGYLINIATIWGDLLKSIYRRSLLHSPTSSAQFIQFHEDITSRMKQWGITLPACYRFTPENIKLAAKNGWLGAIVTMHSFYHNIGMKLNRYVPHLSLTNTQIACHIFAAQRHAESILATMDTLNDICHFSQTSKSPDLNPPKFTSPFVGNCIVSAIDILTAKVPLKSITSRLASFQSSLAVLSELSIYWHSSVVQYNLVQKRILDLKNASTDRVGLSSSNLGTRPKDSSICAMTEAMEHIFARQDDLIYKRNRVVLTKRKRETKNYES